MNSVSAIQHDLRRDIQNILNVLKFVRNDVEIKDEELSSMINYGLSLEQNILEKLDLITRNLKETTHE